MLTKAPKGTRDILPGEIYKWQYLEKLFIKLCENFGFQEIRVPVFEHTELFQRGVGDTTDIVQKEMYTFEDKAGRSITLRPEGTAGVVRSYIENGMASYPQPVKLFYNITAYRYENVQKGRYREFHQFGAEAFGSHDSSVDAEIISLVDMFFKKLKLQNVDLNINSIGCPQCRGEYNRLLLGYFEDKKQDLCPLCRDRLNKNPMRIFDCKEESCKKLTINAPYQLDNLCGDCKAHFEQVKERLTNLGINFVVDKSIVRGLDYYTKTVFEFVSKNVGAQETICGGGRYDGLVKLCKGPDTPGMGFALGVERLLMELESQGVVIEEDNKVDIYLASLGHVASLYCEKLIHRLRLDGINARGDLMDRSLKAQMKYADKLGAELVVVIGDNEIESNKAVMKNMYTKEEKTVSLDSIPGRLKNK